MIIGILGFRGAGKDSIINCLPPERFQRIAFADPLKRLCQKLFNFTDEQLWGSQTAKETGDIRYPREHTWKRQSETFGRCACCSAGKLDEDLPPICYLTPRYALQIMGTECGRHCYADIWVELALKDAERVRHRGFTYTRQYGAEPRDSTVGPTGWEPKPAKHVIFTDNRFLNETQAIQRVGGLVYRVKRLGLDAPPFNHGSETEQLQIPDDRLSGVIMNDGTLEDLKVKVLALAETWQL